MRVASLIFILSALVYMPVADAQTQFIKYKKYLIPISVGVDTETCPELSETKINIFYVDDFGLVEHQDPNGYLDLAIVLGLSKRHSNSINLVGVGVGVAGKTEGLGYGSVDAGSISDAKQMYASAMGVSTNDAKIYSGASLTNKIASLAACSTGNHRLVLALGGLWHDAYYPLINNSDRSNVYVVGITGSNLGQSPSVVHQLIGGQTPSASETTDACDAFRSVYGDTAANCSGVSSMSNDDTFGIGRDDFRDLLDNTSISGNSVYANCLKQFLVNSVGASTEVDIVNELDSPNFGPHRLRIADYGAFALGAGLGPLSNLYTSNFLNDEIKLALRELPGITASSCN